MLVREILRIDADKVLQAGPDSTLAQAVALMAARDVGSLVVVDAGQWVGLVTFREIFAHLAAHGGNLGAVSVAEIMDRAPMTATVAMDVMELRGAMLSRHARYVPVVEGRALRGIVSFHDVARAVYDEQAQENARLKEYINQ